MERPFKIVKKDWGTEVWLVNNQKYCAKELHVDAGWMCSMHFHPKKEETFIVRSGNGMVQIEHNLFVVGMDFRADILAGTWHRFWSDEGMVILEISSHHDDNDVVRCSQSARIEYPLNLLPFAVLELNREKQCLTDIQPFR